MKRTFVTFTAAFLMTTALAIAQNKPTINERRENQQDRIAQGVRSGRLSPRETAHLESREARLNREIRNDRREHDGHLTAGERKRINHQQNRLSKSIYRDKHDGARR